MRITRGRELTTFINNEMDPVIQNAVKEISNGLIYFLGGDLSKAEQAYLCTQLAAQRIIVNEQPTQKTGLHTKLLDHILQYINDSYNYDLRNDEKLKRDLTTHLATLLTRLQFNINTPNPLLNDIKQFYPFAYDVTLDALRSASTLLPYPISEDELGYLAVHIGVSLECNYGTSHHHTTQVLVVTDSGNSTVRVIETKIMREFPQLKFNRALSLQEYEALENIDEDFVITTIRLAEKISR